MFCLLVSFCSDQAADSSIDIVQFDRLGEFLTDVKVSFEPLFSTTQLSNLYHRLSDPGLVRDSGLVEPFNHFNSSWSKDL